MKKRFVNTSYKRILEKMAAYGFIYIDPKVCNNSALYGFIQYYCYPHKLSGKLERKIAAKIIILQSKGFVEFDEDAQHFGDVFIITKEGANFLTEKDNNLRTLFFNFLFGTIGTIIGAAISIATALILK